MCILVCMRTNIVMDEKLVAEAIRLTGIKIRRQLVDEALRTLIEARRRRSLAELQGRIEFAPGYDYKKARERR